VRTVRLDLNPVADSNSPRYSTRSWIRRLSRFFARRAPSPRVPESTISSSPRRGISSARDVATPCTRRESKFNSGCGWPAFDKCYKGALITETDVTFGMKRVEIMCGACDGHLGHVFENEGFSPTMERHCVNSVSVLYKDGPPPTPLEEEKVSTGEGGGGGMFGAASYPLMLLVLAYLLSGVVGKVMDFFTGAQ